MSPITFVPTVVAAIPGARRVVAGPDPDSVASSPALEKAGFVAVRDVVVPDGGPERIYARDLVTTASPSGVRR